MVDWRDIDLIASYGYFEKEDIESAIRKNFYKFDVKLKNGRRGWLDLYTQKFHYLPDGNWTEEQICEDFGRHLKAVLNFRRMSQKDLAVALGMTEATVSGYITGKRLPTFDIVVRIAQILNCGIDDLVYCRYEYGNENA